MLVMIKRDVIPHDKEGGAGNLVRQSTVRNHAVAFYRLVIVKRPDSFVKAPAYFRGLGKGPGKILVPVFLVAFPFGLIVACPVRRYFPAVRGEISNLGKTFDGAGFQHDCQRQDYADAGNGL